MSSRTPLIVILGPTASGKTALSLRLAKKFRGEIISADSRQMYHYMNIGTAKEKGVWKMHGRTQAYFVQGIPHHLVDFLEPDEPFSLARYKKEAKKKIREILERGNIPLLVGGTGLYISAVIDNLNIPRVKPDAPLRASLEEKNEEELLKMLQDFDPPAAKNIDPKNKRRIIRAIEVFLRSGKPFSSQQKKGKPFVNPLIIGIDMPREHLYRRINERTEEQFRQGLVSETKTLMAKGYDFRLPSMSGIGYALIARSLRGDISLEEAKERMKRDTRRYAKRQFTWFRRDKRIHWIQTSEEAEKLAKKFLETEGFLKK